MKKLCIFAVPVREDGVDLSLEYILVGSDSSKKVPVREDGVDLSTQKGLFLLRSQRSSPSARTGWI